MNPAWPPAFLRAASLLTQRWLQHVARWIGESLQPPPALQRAPALIPVRHDNRRGAQRHMRRL